MPYSSLLDTFVELCAEVLGEALTGVYLHGSMALGCFRPDVSDIDLIVVCERGLTDPEKLRLMEGIVALNGAAPPKGLELSFVRRECCNPFVYPTPYELHFSPAHLRLWRQSPEEYLRALQGTDQDLAAHFTILNRCGITLFGADRRDVFGPVPRSDYLDSLWFDIQNAPEDVAENPVYVLLNLCRVLAYVRQGTVLSKKEGGEWGETHVEPEYSGLVHDALACYVSAEKRTFDPALARRFATHMLSKIRACEA